VEKTNKIRHVAIVRATKATKKYSYKIFEQTKLKRVKMSQKVKYGACGPAGPTADFSQRMSAVSWLHCSPRPPHHFYLLSAGLKHRGGNL